MVTTALLAAGGGGYGTFIAGFLLGAGIGFLLGPAVRSWLAYREWAEASREAHMAEEILSRMQWDARLDTHGAGESRSVHPSRSKRASGTSDADDLANPSPPWPASR